MSIPIANPTSCSLVRRAIAWLALATCPLTSSAAELLAPSQQAAAVDAQLDWRRARLIAVQDGGRYKPLDSFARESLSAMTGREHLPGLSPLASLFEWLFNKQAYVDCPVIKIPNQGVLTRLVQHLDETQRQRIRAARGFTPREAADPTIDQVLRALESDPMTRRAANQARTALAYARHLDQLLALVPQPGANAVAPWLTPPQVLGNLADETLAELGISRAALPVEARFPVPGLTPDQALAITVSWTSLRAAWLRGDAENVQKYIDRLAEQLPALAAPGVYPDRAQRAAEARYYAAGKFTYGWMLYFAGLLVGILALVTGWRVPWLMALLLVLGGLGVHVYGLGLRWYILGRIPVANMFEAVVASTAVGITIALVVEALMRMRVLLVAAAFTGFMALVAGQYVLPGSELSTIPAILDDIQLRIHTVMVITAYALMFLAAAIAVVYLVGYYTVRARQALGAATPQLVTARVGDGTAALAVRPRRPLLAGASPGDDPVRDNLPPWLNHIDWSHLIILNMVVVLMFVGGIVLGAWWADYSWGRPWGWDPKEVFALNTWIVYAILIHVRFVVRNRGLWTAWLSIAGCTMMAFNWFFVNFYIVSIHSYA